MRYEDLDVDNQKYSKLSIIKFIQIINGNKK